MSDGIRYARNGDVRLAYETFGDADGEPLLLVMGLDFQMVWWPEEFIARLVDAGFTVTRFDNRDTGLSTHFDPVARPNPWKALLGRVPPAYTARDMLDDAVAVMDTVGWPSAHILGGSMGAGLAQALAMENPERVRSLISCMGLPVDAGPVRTLRYIRPGVFRTLARIKPGPSDDEQVEALVAIYRAIASPGYPFPEDWARHAAPDQPREAPPGPLHHPAPTRRRARPPLPAPGDHHRPHPGHLRPERPARPLAGRPGHLARIHGSRFVLYPGMGHNLPRELFRQITEEVARVASTWGPASDPAGHITPQRDPP